MRIGISFGLGKRVRVGASIGSNGRTQLWARERIGRRAYLSQAASVGKKGRRR